jgi:hypothetical protein
MYTSAFLTPSKESTLARTKSIMNTFSPKSTNINTGDASQTTTVVEQITGRKPYLLVNLPRIMQELSSSSFLGAGSVLMEIGNVNVLGLDQPSNPISVLGIDVLKVFSIRFDIKNGRVILER